jgi:hypothetical protein
MRKACQTMSEFFPEWKAEALRHIAESGIFVAVDYIDKGIAAYKYMGDGTDGQD